jgi:hypothetical protein
MALKHKKMQVERRRCQMCITREMSSSEDANDPEQNETKMRR